jgi:multidrug transporter EmrE-like cation transporter
VDKGVAVALTVFVGGLIALQALTMPRVAGIVLLAAGTFLVVRY